VTRLLCSIIFLDCFRDGAFFDKSDSGEFKVKQMYFPYIESGQKKLIALALALSCQVLPAALPALAGDGSIRLAGQVVLVNKSGTDKMSLDERTETIQQNLDNALIATADRSPASVDIVYSRGLPVVTLGGYKIVTVDDKNAKAAGTTPALLAQRWAQAIASVLRDRASVDAYLAQLSGEFSAPAPPVAQASLPQAGPPYGQGQAGYPPQGQAYNPYAGAAVPAYQGAPAGGYQRGYVVYAPAGLTFQATLNTSITSDVAKPGDLVQATISQNVPLGNSSIPAGSTLVGTVTDAKSGGFLGTAGTLGITFNRLRMPNGVETPLNAHILGSIGKYATGVDDTMRGETWKTKAGQAAIRGGLGAGLGAATGTAIGAIAAGSGRGTGRGAWSGAAIGGGLGLAQSLLARKGKDVVIPSGTTVQVQLDSPVAISAGGVPPYTGAF